MAMARSTSTKYFLEGCSVMSKKWYYLCDIEKLSQVPYLKKFYGEKLYTEYRVVREVTSITRDTLEQPYDPTDLLDDDEYISSRHR